jgi:gliding motility-associated-like protein
VLAKPPITLPFRDTLICVPDNLQLHASGVGTFSWLPPAGIINPNTSAPTVSPTTTTTYFVQLNQQGCINTDSITVRVVDHVSLSARVDTTSCQGDPVQLSLNSDALQYEWFPTISLDNPTVKNPVATPTTTSTYTVVARIGNCTATENVTVFVVPYPFVKVAPDTIICFNTPAQLYGSYRGTSYSWSPGNYLNNPNSINPIAVPPRTTTFVLTVYDTLGCPKPGYDSIVVNVLPKIRPFAGNDTLVVVGQPLQLNAEGGSSYLWTPATGLNNPSISDPVGRYDDSFESIRYTVRVFNEAGCYDSAFVNVKVFKTNPYVFVPSAFTPNGDGLNDVIRPIAVGVQEIKYFRIYNRWGQMIFSTTQNHNGWDGKIGGTPQGSNVFVWMVSAIDYTGKPIFLKGTVTLIR